MASTTRENVMCHIHSQDYIHAFLMILCLSERYRTDAAVLTGWEGRNHDSVCGASSDKLKASYPRDIVACCKFELFDYQEGDTTKRARSQKELVPMTLSRKSIVVNKTAFEFVGRKVAISCLTADYAGRHCLIRPRSAMNPHEEGAKARLGTCTFPYDCANST